MCMCMLHAHVHVCATCHVHVHVTEIFGCRTTPLRGSRGVVRAVVHAVPPAASHILIRKFWAAPSVSLSCVSPSALVRFLSCLCAHVRTHGATRRATCTCTYVHVSMHVLRASRRAEIRARHREEHRVPPDRVPTNTSHTLTSCWRNQPYRGRRGRRSPRGQERRAQGRRGRGAYPHPKVFKEPGTRAPWVGAAHHASCGPIGTQRAADVRRYGESSCAARPRSLANWYAM